MPFEQLYGNTFKHPEYIKNTNNLISKSQIMYPTRVQSCSRSIQNIYATTTATPQSPHKQSLGSKTSNSAEQKSVHQSRINFMRVHQESQSFHSKLFSATARRPSKTAKAPKKVTFKIQDDISSKFY